MTYDPLQATFAYYTVGILFTILLDYSIRTFKSSDPLTLSQAILLIATWPFFLVISLIYLLYLYSKDDV